MHPIMEAVLARRRRSLSSRMRELIGLYTPTPFSGRRDEPEPYLVIETMFDRHGNRVGQWAPIFFGKTQHRPAELRPPHLYTLDELQAAGVVGS